MWAVIITWSHLWYVLGRSLTLEKLLLTEAGGAVVASLAGDCCCLTCCWG